jgi:oxygen-independent coproporphyrinogen-3 oxidase
MNNLGIYIHVPFCAIAKCPYCDFYSVTYNDILAEQYTQAVVKSVVQWGKQAGGRIVDAVYFGGGTPALLEENLAVILIAIKNCFNVTADAEITFEANPTNNIAEFLPVLRKAGFNRLSLGLQSANDNELAALGRQHTAKQAAESVTFARSAGFENISLDLMLCTPGQTMKSLEKSIEYIAELQPKHVSAYLLKIEQGTPYAKAALILSNDDEQADAYLFACEQLEKYGFMQYEISNFARPKFEARHNLKYWQCEEYIGIGAAAHSYFEGRRFYYERDVHAFINGAIPTDDCDGGSFEEYCMLGLRLTKGLQEQALKQRYNKGFEAFDGAVIQKLIKAGLVILENGCLRLTREGFLVSNLVIGEVLRKSLICS